MILEKGMGGISATDPVKTSVKYVAQAAVLGGVPAAENKFCKTIFSDYLKVPNVRLF